MSHPQSGHAGFDELAAGYALNALEPADERRFAQHAETCPYCQQSVAEFREVVSALAETAPPTGPSQALGQRILLATSPGRNHGGSPVATGIREAAPPPDVTPLRPRSRRPGPRWRWVAAAAAVVVAAGGIWGGLAATSANRPAPVALCAPGHGCTEVTLRTAGSHQLAAKVVVRGRRAWMRPAHMTASPTGQFYVLWQVTRSDGLFAVGRFSIRPGADTPIAIGTLTAPFASTQGFAVSLEHGPQLPPRPSNTVALGQVF